MQDNNVFEVELENKDEKITEIKEAKEKKLTKKEKDELILKELKDFDLKYIDDKEYLCGVDEAGRGPLAGPVVVASVILPKDSNILGINDSKKISEKKREELFEKIKEEAIDFKIEIVEPEIIDEINILNATKLACKNAINNLKIKPDLILVDALKDLDIEYEYKSIIKGDLKSYSIAAASILAKVFRDNLMKDYSLVYPEYGFERHKGYGTKLHYEAIEKNGITDIHRKTFLH